MCHSIDKGTRIRCLFDLTEEKLEEIKSKMRELVNSNLPIEKCIVKRKEAINYFKQTTNTSVAANYYYTTSNYVTLYKSWFGDNVDCKIIESAIVFWFMDDDY